MKNASSLALVIRGSFPSLGAILFEEVPCVAGFIDDVVVVEDGNCEFIVAQIFPDVFNQIEFESVGSADAQG
jgi:hypothetical protein